MSGKIIIPNTAQLDAPQVLLPYQSKWLSDLSPVKVFEKSRRTGVTWSEASDNVLTAASNGGQNVYYVGYNYDMTVEYIQAAAMWSRAFNYAASNIEEGFWDEGDADKNIKTFTIRYPESGYRIEALSSRPANLRGRQGVLVIDEAAFHDRLNDLIDAALAFLIWGGRVRLISTHFGEGNPFNTFIQDIRAKHRAGTVHRITFREAVAQGLYKRVCLRLGKIWTPEGEQKWVDSVYSYYGDGAAQELDCIPSQSSGAWLTRALIESRMSRDTPVLRLNCPAGYELYSDARRERETADWIKEHLDPQLAALPANAHSFLGRDFGRSGDLSVDYPLIQQRDLTRRVPFTIELRQVPFRQQEQITWYLMDNLPNLAGAAFDARGNGSFLAEYAIQRYGASRVQAVMLSESWYLEHMPPLKAALEDGTLLALPQDEDTLNDLRSVQVIRGVPRVPEQRATAQDGGKRHGDSVIALALAWYASREMTAGPVTVTSRRPRTMRSLLEGY